MANQSRIIRSFEVTKGDATHVEVKLYYDMGGYNYFTGDLLERGLKLSVQPIKKSVSECGKYTTTSFMAFSGISRHLLTLKRFSQKTFNDYVVDEDTITALVNYVINKNSIELKEN